TSQIQSTEKSARSPRRRRIVGAVVALAPWFVVLATGCGGQSLDEGVFVGGAGNDGGVSSGDSAKAGGSGADGGTTTDGATSGDSGPCASGAARACYTGPAPTRGVGACKDGKETCVAGTWGPCVGDTKPGTETCNGVDDNCDGQVDEGCSCVNGSTQAC